MREGATLALSGRLHNDLMTHLLTEDGEEAVAIVLCARVEYPRVKLLAQRVVLIPHEVCTRQADSIIWPGTYLEEAIELAEEQDLSLILMHSHPGGFFAFSEADDVSDADVFPSIFAARSKALVGTTLHGSAIMVPGGAIQARLYDKDMRQTPVELTAVYGDDINFFWHPNTGRLHADRRPLAFTSEMRSELGLLSICFIGASGTGSIAAEQAARLGFGEIILIDFDRVEEKNLNRILNSTEQHAREGAAKVDVLADAIRQYRSMTVVRPIRSSIASREAIDAAASADILFCCVDSEEGRSICDRLSSAMVMPLFDVGVTIPVNKGIDGRATIFDVLGRIDYVQPGGSSLADRKVYTPQSLAAEDLAKRAPGQHTAQVKAGYMPGLQEEAPSVITVNMRAASAAVQEFIARAYPYRLDPNNLYARSIFSLSAMDEDLTSEVNLPHSPPDLLGTGFIAPLLGLLNWGSAPGYQI